MKAASRVLLFGPNELDLSRYELRRRGRRVRVSRSLLELLHLLADRRGALVTREEIAAQLWTDPQMVDVVQGINTAVGRLRGLLNDDPAKPRYIETVIGRGYRFVAPVEEKEGGREVEAPEPDVDTEQAGIVETASPPPVAWSAPNPPPVRLSWYWWAMLGAALIVAATWLGLSRRKVTRAELTSTTVTSYPGNEVDPAPSPDGSEVAFSWTGEGGENGDIYVTMAAGTAPRRLTSDPAYDEAPGWAPDGSRISFVRAGESLMIANPLGGGERKLGRAASFFTAWTPDSKQVLHSAWISGESQIAVFTTDPDTGVRRQLTFPPRGWIGDVYAALSPSGTQLAFARYQRNDCDIHILDMTGGRDGKITGDRQITKDRAPIRGLTWNPNGRAIVYASRRNGQMRLWEVDASGSGHPEPVPESGEDAITPRFAASRRGPSRLFYVQTFRDSNIWRMEMNGKSPPVRLIASTRIDSSPQISPDGRHIAFESDRNGWHEIWVADADGVNQSALTSMHLQQTGSPRWSPDGRRIAFDANSDQGRAIFVVDLAGGPPRQWTPWRSGCRPSWSRDGRWIYFGDTDPGKSEAAWQVWKVSTGPDRTLQRVTTDGGVEAFESVDGKSLFYTRGSELRRMAVSGGPSSLVLNRPITHGWWGVARDGIYFVDLSAGNPAHRTVFPGAKPVYRLNPVSGVLSQVASVIGKLSWDTPDFCVSPDGKVLLYSLLELSSSQIRMIEGLE